MTAITTDSAALDDALVRPHRFSTDIALEMPDLEGRRRLFITQVCRKLDLADQGLRAWLDQYVHDHRGHLQAAVGEHEFWSVPLGLMLESTREVLTPAGRNSGFLASCIEDDAILAIHPITATPSRRAVKTQAILEAVVSAMVRLTYWALDPICKWGVRTCPACLSGKRIVPMRLTSDETTPPHICAGCNTIWPPRS